MIIHDFLDNDLYKFTAMNAIQKKFPDSEVVYRFVNRGNTSFPPGFADALKKEVEAMAGVVLSKENEKFMRAKCYYFDSVFFDLLKGFRFNPAEVKVSQEGGKLDVEIRGLWYRTVLWEVPLMAMISELYFRMTGQVARDLKRNATEKARAFADIKAEISEFGTRRRYSFDVQDRVIGILKENMKGLLNGTSNVYFAMKYDLIPMGTHPHEWFMYHGAHFGYRSANALALENWVDVYDGYLGYSLDRTRILPIISLIVLTRSMPSCLMVYVGIVVILLNSRRKHWSITGNIGWTRKVRRSCTVMHWIWRE